MKSHLKTKELLQERQLYVGPPEGNEYPLQNLSKYKQIYVLSESWHQSPIEMFANKKTTLDSAAILTPNPDPEISSTRSVKWGQGRGMESLPKFQTP